MTSVQECFFCSYSSSTTLDLVKHLFESHSSQANFRLMCGINSCSHTFCSGSTFASFKTHALRKHPRWRDCISTVSLQIGPVLDQNNDQLNEMTDLESNSYDADHATGGTITAITTSSLFHPSAPSSEHVAALFLLTLQERYRLPQAAVNFALSSVNDILSNVCVAIQQSVIQALEADKNSEIYPCIEECFNHKNPFVALQSEYQQTKFYKENFSLIQPTTIKLGTARYKYQGHGSKRRLVERYDEFQYVPLLQNLESVLQQRDLYREVFENSGHCSDSNYMVDFSDGQLFQDHPLFSTDKHALQIILYWDDVEVANPLGSHHGVHKLSMFYYFLGNVNPKLRSVLKSTFLLACVTSKNVVKYGLQLILQPFIDEMNKLSKGVTMTIRGQEKIVKGGLLYCLADTLAAHHIGGFKIGVGFSLRKCRMCMATKDEISTKFRSKMFTMRTPESYNYHCLLLDGPLCKEDSVTYGINFPSPLNMIANFHVVDQLPQDIMHILLEGVVPYELVHMLVSYTTEEKFFSIDVLNDRIACFVYSNQELRDKPSPIKWQSLTSCSGKNMNQSSSQIWILASYLPLLIGDLIPQVDEKWECFLLLLDILQICTAKVLTPSHAGILEALIDYHHSLFTHCYPNLSVTPKMHFMVHFPQQLIRTGPFVNVWCMRMEAKNSYCKKIGQSSNFKNVPYTVAHKHQRLLCSYLNSSESFFDTDVKCGPVKGYRTLQSEDTAVIAKITEAGVSDDVATSRPKWIVSMGIKYSLNEFVIIGWEVNDLPIFGRINEIISAQQRIVFRLKKYVTSGIVRHYHSFLIKKTNEDIVLLLEKIAVHQVYQGHMKDYDSLYITIRSHVEKY